MRYILFLICIVKLIKRLGLHLNCSKLDAYGHLMVISCKNLHSSLHKNVLLLSSKLIFCRFRLSIRPKFLWFWARREGCYAKELVRPTDGAEITKYDFTAREKVIISQRLIVSCCMYSSCIDFLKNVRQNIQIILFYWSKMYVLVLKLLLKMASNDHRFHICRPVLLLLTYSAVASF